MQYIMDGIKMTQFSGEVTFPENITVMETFDGRDDDCVSNYEFTEDGTSNASDFFGYLI